MFTNTPPRYCFYCGKLQQAIAGHGYDVFTGERNLEYTCLNPTCCFNKDHEWPTDSKNCLKCGTFKQA